MILTTDIPIQDGGIVLLNNYMPLLFSRMGLLDQKRLMNDNARSYAANTLLYLVYGREGVDESLGTVSKILCGMKLEEPLQPLTITKPHIELINGLLQAFINQWSAVSTSSFYGFRGNWLIRNGILKQYSDKWNMVVEKRPYDVLLRRTPFSFSVIKHNWMSIPLTVQW